MPLLEGMDIEKPSKLVAGPLYNTFTDILKRIDASIHELNPEYTAEYIMPWGYRSTEIKEASARLGHRDRRALESLMQLKLSLLRNVPRSSQAEFLNRQSVPSNLLNVPYYARQKEDWKYISEDSKGCTNACFRMIFGSITGWVPSQAAVAESLLHCYDTSVVDDAVYSGIYKTEIFSEICDKEVKTVEIIGADFAMIARLTERIKQKRAGIEVYCTVNLESQAATSGVWHTAVLLGGRERHCDISRPIQQQGRGVLSSTDI